MPTSVTHGRIAMSPIEIEYHFVAQSGQSESFKVSIDPVSLESIHKSPGQVPPWTALHYHQCPNCPLDTIRHCPAAVNMVGLVERFDQLLSYDRINVSVITSERMIRNNTSVQRGICSLLGLMMASSGCPLTAFFKPMARFHLPFASTEETIWRATATYLMAQYFRRRMGGDPDLSFQGLNAVYRQIQIVNTSFAQRLRSACRYDSMINAIILLDMFAKSMPYALEESLEQVRDLFVPTLKHTDDL